MNCLFFEALRHHEKLLDCINNWVMFIFCAVHGILTVNIVERHNKKSKSYRPLHMNYDIQMPDNLNHLVEYNG